MLKPGKIFKSPNFWPLLIVIFSAIIAGRSLIFEKGYFTMHDDLQMMRQLEMEKCIFDGQIPCRWVPDMGYGYGFPLFNFYPPLPYYSGEIFRIFQFSFTDTAKLTFALSFILSAVTMYFLAKEFYGKTGGIISSVFYIWAPYHSVDVYVRGAMNEAWALIWFPLILLTSYKLIKEKASNSKWIIGLALSWAGLLLSHNLMVLIFTPVFAVWCLVFWVRGREIQKIIKLFLSGLLALCLAAFFTLPAVLEQKLIHVDTLTQGYYEYIAHFATIGQLLFSRFWGYGASIWGPNDAMPFPVGQIHWILSLVVVLLGTVLFFKRKKPKIKPDVIYVTYFSIVFAWFAAFMAHQNSTFIWQHIKPLAFVQFPWRFLALSTFGFSLAAGSVIELISKKLALVSGVILIFIVIIFNWNFFEPLGHKMGPLTDNEKFNGAAWDLQRTAGIFDYLPLSAKQNPKDPPRTIAEVVSGSGSISNISQGTNWAKFKVNLSDDSVIRINLFQFANWKILVDGKTAENYIPDTEVYGRMYLNLASGSHTVFLKLNDTPIRSLSNIISALTWLGLGLFLIKFKKASI